jgi:hypothetical protein
MSEVLEYKCPACGAPLIFDAEKQQMSCEYCGNEYSVEYLKQDEKARQAHDEPKEDVDIKWEIYDNDTLEAEGMSIYSCTSCGAEIVGDDNMAATHCLYCGSPAVITKQLTGIYRPDYVIPFKMGKPDAKEAILKLCKGKMLLPKGFKDDHHIEEIKGVYVPFWLFDCGSHGNIDFKATVVKTWSDSKYNYTRTDHYSINREGELDFVKVPIDGSSKIENIMMEAIEPFDYDEAVDFKTAYLSGYLADKYDVESGECKDRINERIKTSTVDVLKDTIERNRYTTVMPVNTNVNVKQGKIQYALLPVWMLNTKYKDKMYPFLMNGQTGKFIGQLPVSMGKYFAWLGGITAGVTAILAIMILLGGGYI